LDSSTAGGGSDASMLACDYRPFVACFAFCLIVFVN